MSRYLLQNGQELKVEAGIDGFGKFRGTHFAYSHLRGTSISEDINTTTGEPF